MASTRVRSGLAVVTVLLVLAGCGNKDQTNATAGTGGSPTTQPVAPATGDASTTQSVAPTTAPAPKAVAYRILSNEEMTRALLAVKDLPPGYSQDPPEAPRPDKTFCDYKPPFDAHDKVSRTFTKGGGLSSELLSVGLRQYASPEEAKAAFTALTDTLASCTGETVQGRKVTYAPMSAPKVGDGAVGVKANIDGSDVLQFYALAGPTVINTGGGGLMNASADEVTTLLGAQVNAYQAAATQ